MLDEQDGETEEMYRNVGGARSATLLSREPTNVDKRRSVTSLPLSSTVSGWSCLLSSALPSRLLSFSLYFRLFFLFRPVHVPLLDIIALFSGLSWPLAARVRDIRCGCFVGARISQGASLYSTTRGTLFFVLYDRALSYLSADLRARLLNSAHP
jgi:hypothetical protein